MSDEANPKNERINALLNNPVSYGIFVVIAIAMVAMGWLDGLYALVLIGLAAFGTFRWYQKRKNQ